MCHVSNKHQPPNDLAKYQHFHTRNFILLLHFEKKLALYIANIFAKHPYFTTLTVSEVCNISNKYWLPNKSATKIFLHQAPDTVSSFQQNIYALHRRIFWKHPLFTTCQLVFTVDELWTISNKYRSHSNIPKY